VFWFSFARKTWWIIIPTVMLTLVGMWCERFSIIVTSMHRDFMPSSWHMYVPTWVDICTFAGTVGLFMTLFLLFCRFLPVVAMSEIKTILPQAQVHSGAKK